MATELQVQLLGISPQKDAIDLAVLVKDATWKDVLVELVRKSQFDPWNIDISEIVDKYITTVKALKVMDLRIPANILLAAAVLLRLKSEVLSFAEPEPVPEGSEHFIRPDVQVDGLTLRLRPPLKRKIALTELIEAMEEAMSMKEQRATARFNAVPIVPMTIEKVDIEEELNKLHSILRKHADKKRMITFSYLLKAGGFSDILLELFAPMLYLASRGRITLIQEQFFGEIIIALNK